VQRNAALSLVRFADPAGHALIAGMLGGYTVNAPRAGTLSLRLKQGDVINPGTLLAHIKIGNENAEVRSEVPGSIRNWIPADNSEVKGGEPLLLVDPSPEMVWASLRAPYLIGRKEDLPAVNSYVRGVDGLPAQIQQQAQLTAQEISTRGSK
jgi:multidrug efflux pump subunit AcrA (membrane-fusion protein)